MVETGFRTAKSDASAPSAKWSRVVIEGVKPQVDNGKYAAKAVLGEPVKIEANIHADGHNALACIARTRKTGTEAWHETPMKLIQSGLDLYQAEFDPPELGFFEFTIEAWIDQFANWKRDTHKKFAAGQPIALELQELVLLIDDAVTRADAFNADKLREYRRLVKEAEQPAQALSAVSDPQLDRLLHKYGNRGQSCEYGNILPLMVEPERALYGAWYELFPRSVPSSKGHGTFKDVIKHLPYVAEMGFDVLYLPPIHPIGAAHRKGKNNTLQAQPGDPGSPWAIGGQSGGHKSIHPDLGTIGDFDELVSAALGHGLEIALDIAFQCSPDHPYVREHPEWFYHRPDGTIRYAENPPKKYEDIYPIDFECADWQNLWRELTDVVLFWVSHGVHIFRVDNPHTKPYAFWQYLISEVKKQQPNVIFLSEAFARPKVMYHLAKVGFSQSYSYFTWRNTKREIMDYFSEAYLSPVADYFRPNLFANTPDILPEFLQFGGRNAFMIRLVLAATLGASYGIYGPAYELCVADAVPGTEEYKDSEKYEVRKWDRDARHSLSEFITRINRIRHENPALHRNRNLRFLMIDNNDMVAYAKTSADGLNAIVTVVNLSPHYAQGGSLFLPASEFGTDKPYQVHDLITGMRFLWNGETNFVRLEPHVSPAFVFRILKKIRTERDFDYFV